MTQKLAVLTILFPALCVAGEAYDAAREAYAARDFQKAVVLLEQAAQQEPISDYAEYFIGRNYHYGSYTEENPNKAIYWLRRAAKKGYAVAQYDLSYALRDVGEKEESAYWLTQAAEQGLSAAYRPLVAIYYTGDGIKTNMQKACAWQMLVSVFDVLPDERLKCREILSVDELEEAEMFAAEIRTRTGKYKKFEDN